MKHLKPYKLFESIDFKSLVNQSLLNDLYDLSLELLDEGYQLAYFVRLGDYTVLSGGRKFVDDFIPEDEPPITTETEISKNWEDWTNFKPEYDTKIKDLLKKEPLAYFFRIYKGDSRNYVVYTGGQSEILRRIKEMYPNEEIGTL